MESMPIVEPSIHEALQYIATARGHLAAQGNNDREFSELHILSQEVEEGRISPVEAIQKVDALQEAKLSR
jgi:hypothetical protein